MKKPIKNHIVLACALFVSISASHAAEFEYPLYGEAAQLYSNSVPYDLTHETYTFSTLWSVPVQPDLNFLPGSYHSPIATRGDSTFVLFVDPDHRLKVAHLTNGVFKAEAFVDNNLYQANEFYDGNGGVPGYHTFKFEDGHHSASLGIDENGYLHLVGDMHNYPRYVDSMSHLPKRYFDKNIMYWRSDNPLDISSFSFKGDQAGECPPGFGFTYQFFFNDLNGQLHMTSRAHQATDNSIRCALFSCYDADTGTWTAIGGPDPDDPGSAPRTFYDDGWEYDLEGGTTNSSGNYSKTSPHGVFDRNNNMHLVAPLLSDPTFNPWGMGNAQHFVDTILYAQSTNGTDFTKADEAPITLPATINLTPNHADIIYNAPTDRYLSVLGNMAVDYQNNPYTVVRQKSYDPVDPQADNQSLVLGWDGTAWTNYGEIVVATTDFRLVHDPAGVMSYIPDSLNKFYRFWKPTDTLQQIDLPASWPYIKTIDYEYLKKTGNIMGLTRDGDDLVVVKVEIDNRPGMELIDPPVETITNHPPEITLAAAATPAIIGSGDSTTLSVEATDADGDPLIYTWHTQYGPGPVGFSINGTTASSNTTATFAWYGTYELKVGVSDGFEERISTCYVTVTQAVTTAKSFQIGGLADERNADWNQSTSIDASTGSYSFADDEDPDLVFTITSVAHNGDLLDLNTSFIGVDSSWRQTDDNNGRISLDESVSITVSYVDPNGSLADVAVDQFGPFWGNKDEEITVFTDTSANSTNIAAFNHTIPFNLIRYSQTGLDPLTKYNTAIWSMTVSPDHSLGATATGMGGLMLTYMVDIGGPNSPAYYTEWLGGFGLAGTDAMHGADPDNDTMDNLTEYALGGNPTSNDAAEKLPIIGIGEQGGTNWFNYIYNCRRDAAARQLTYDVLATDDLVSNVWTNTTEEAGSVALDAKFESVTNRVPTNTEAQQFLKLEVGISE